MGMTTIGKIWVKGYQVFESLYLEFDNKELKSYKIVPELDIITEDVVNEIVKDLISQKMITFFDDIPSMSVNVEIHDIPSISKYNDEDPELIYIETFHYYNDEESEMIDRDCDVSKPLHEFMGITTPVTLSDF